MIETQKAEMLFLTIPLDTVRVRDVWFSVRGTPAYSAASTHGQIFARFKVRSQ